VKIAEKDVESAKQRYDDCGEKLSRAKAQLKDHERPDEELHTALAHATKLVTRAESELSLASKESDSEASKLGACEDSCLRLDEAVKNADLALTECEQNVSAAEQAVEYAKQEVDTHAAPAATAEELCKESVDQQMRDTESFQQAEEAYRQAGEWADAAERKFGEADGEHERALEDRNEKRDERDALVEKLQDVKERLKEQRARPKPRTFDTSAMRRRRRRKAPMNAATSVRPQNANHSSNSMLVHHNFSGKL